MPDLMVSVVATLKLDCPKDDAVAVLCDMANVAIYEEKVDRVELFPETETTGIYRPRGKFAGLIPWWNSFRYEFHDSGFHSYDAGKPIMPGLNISGGFAVSTLQDGCLVIHYEEYHVPWPLFPFKTLIGSYLKMSMKPEMRRIRQLVAERRRR